MGRPSVFPTGVTKYDRSRAYNGYTLYHSEPGLCLIDMNGRLVRIWKGVNNTAKPLADGDILACRGSIPVAPGRGSYKAVVVFDWNGQEQWLFTRNIRMTMQDGTSEWVACAHHDLEVIGDKKSVFAQEAMPGNVLILTHKVLKDEKISRHELLDERIIEVDRDGETVWEWNAHEHFDEFGLSDEAKTSLYEEPVRAGGDIPGDWIHLNAISTLGANSHYESRDKRFHPDNIICSSRQLNCVFIIDKQSGAVVWRLGPDCRETEEAAAIGQIIGQHCVYMIPKGVPGEGNVILYDNGGFGGFSAPTPVAFDGVNSVRRHYSRVLEIDPSTMKTVWEYSQIAYGPMGRIEMCAHNFFSPYISSVQRLPNGNTLINQGADGQFSDVTPEKEKLWEYQHPFKNSKAPTLMQNSVYRAYRVPYDWAPIEAPEEVNVVPPEPETYRVPGSFQSGDPDAVSVSVVEP